MKKLLLIVMVLLIATVAYAQQCDETDNGIDYETKGSVKYGVTTMTDSCILSKHTEMSIEEGVWLKEYYCDDDNRRRSETVDCTREGYEKCYLGECTGKENVEARQEAEKATAPKCGNGVVEQDLGEECDPPGRVCYADGGYGQCDKYCKCPLEIDKSGVVKPKENVTANVTTNITVEEEPEEIVPLPEIEKIEPVEIIPEPEVEEEKPGFFARIWNWFKGLFS